MKRIALVSVALTALLLSACGVNNDGSNDTAVQSRDITKPTRVNNPDNNLTDDTELDTDPAASIVIAALINLAHALGFQVIAEGAETRQQVERLRALECDEIQGYYYARPTTAARADTIARHGLTIEIGPPPAASRTSWLPPGSNTCGFRMPRDRARRLIARYVAISAGLRTRCRYARLAVPMPCSALIEPCSSATSSNTAVGYALVVGRDAGDVDVNVAVARVTEQPHRRRRARSRHARRDALNELAERSAGSVTSSLCGAPEQVDRLGVRLAIAPQSRAAAAHRSRPRRPPPARSARPRRASASVGSVWARRLDEHVRGVRGRETVARARTASHTRSRPSAKNSSIALHAVELPAQVADRVERGIDVVEREQRDHRRARRARRAAAAPR